MTRVETSSADGSLTLITTVMPVLGVRPEVVCLVSDCGKKVKHSLTGGLATGGGKQVGESR